MSRYFLILTILLTGAANAENSLAKLVGNWSGSGTYYEALSKASMKCRLSVAGTAATVRMVGRCGSSLGAQDIALEFVQQGGGLVLLSPNSSRSVETEIENVSGAFAGNQLNLSGQAPGEDLRIQFVFNQDGSLNFATDRKWRTGRSRSLVTLRRQ